jgi:hypothetical protein
LLFFLARLFLLLFGEPAGVGLLPSTPRSSSRPVEYVVDVKYVMIVDDDGRWSKDFCCLDECTVAC